jgi:hypothetical protein
MRRNRAGRVPLVTVGERRGKPRLYGRIAGNAVNYCGVLTFRRSEDVVAAVAPATKKL